jgi:acyl carrier protein
MTGDLERRVRQVMADILALDAARIDDSTSTDSVERWDSANHINLVLALEEEFGVSFDVAEIEAMTSFAKLLAVVAAKISPARTTVLTPPPSS